MYLAPVVVRTVTDVCVGCRIRSGVTLVATAEDPAGCDLTSSSLNWGPRGRGWHLQLSLPAGSWLVEPEAAYLC